MQDKSVKRTVSFSKSLQEENPSYALLGPLRFYEKYIFMPIYSSIETKLPQQSLTSDSRW